MVVTRLLDGPNPADLQAMQKLPTKVFPSDHFRMGAKFKVFYGPEEVKKERS